MKMFHNERLTMPEKIYFNIIMFLVFPIMWVWLLFFCPVSLFLFLLICINFVSDFVKRI